MGYTFETIILIVAVLALVSSRRIVQFFTLINLKFKNYEPRIVKPSAVEQQILVEVAKIEKFLYKNRFTRRVIVRHQNLYNEDKIFYKFYYYQLIDGIHAYIKVTPQNSTIEYEFCFETKYDSGNVALSINKEYYLLLAIPDRVYRFLHKNFTIEELYKAHLKDREIETRV